jgi:peptide/nickel transport system substrate-binding protein
LYNRITRIGRDGEVAPDLAEEWDVSADAMRWTFRIRQGVSFHDGRPCTARDAAYTVRRLLDPDLASPQHGVLAPLMEPDGVSAPDDHTLVIDLISPQGKASNCVRHTFVRKEPTSCLPTLHPFWKPRKSPKASPALRLWWKFR